MPRPIPLFKNSGWSNIIFQQSRHKASLRVSASANFRSLRVTPFNLKTDRLRPYYASFVFGGNYCPGCCWWSLTSAEVPAGYPYKNSNNPKKKKQAGDDGKRKIFCYFLHTTNTRRASWRSFVYGPLTSIQATAARFQLKKWG